VRAGDISAANKISGDFSVIWKSDLNVGLTKARRLAWLAGTALPAFAFLTLLTATPVVAAGGTGGNSQSNQATGGAGGSTITDGTGQAGDVGGFSNSANSGGGGGGGGAGNLGGAGGQGGNSGGAGGTTASPNGQAGVNPDSGGGGGAGGSHGQVGATFAGAGGFGTDGGNGGAGVGNGGGGGGGEGGFGAYLTGAGPHNLGNAFVGGGSGGRGGQGGGNGGLGGNGGDGGIGAYLAAASTVNNNAGAIVGGTGGTAGARGGSSNSGGGTGGAGGAGISGVAGLVITNAASQGIQGGNGGNSNGAQSAGGAGGAGIAVLNSSITNNGFVVGGNGGFGAVFGGTAGAGGAGIVGSGLTIINSGSIYGGAADGGGGAQANAITFTGGANALTLQTGWLLIGGIGLQTASTSVNLEQSIAVNLANVITGAGSVINSGTGALTLSGANTYSGGTTLATGSTLQIGTNQVLNGATLVSSAIGTGTLTFDGGKLQAQSGMSEREIANAVQITGNGGTIDSGSGFFRFTGNITDAAGASGGKLVIESTGVGNEREVILAGNNTYSAITSIASGTVIANSTTALSPNSAFQVNKGATLTLSGFNNTIASLADGASGGGVVQNAGAGGTATLTISGAAGVTTSFSGVLQNGSSGGVPLGVAGEGAIPSSEGGSILALVKSGPSTQILAGANTYTGTTTINGGVLEVDGSIASSSMTTVNANGVLTGTGTVGNTTVASGGTLLPGNGIAGSSLAVAGNLAFQSGALYLVQVSPATSTFTHVSGTATLNGLAGASFASGSYVSKQYTILTAAGGVSGTFTGLQTLGLPSGFTASLSYDAKDAYLNLALNFTPPSSGPNYGGGLNINQQNVANALTNFFNATGGIPMVFGTLTPAGLTQVSGELATGSQQATFDAMNLFMGLLTDPFVAGRGGSQTPGAGAPTGYASAATSGAARDAYAMFTKALPPVTTFEQRWSVWGAGFGGSQTTDGDAVVGSNTATSSVFGTVIGADYRISPYTVAGFALAGGGTNFSVANSGSGHSDLFQAGAFVRHTVGAAYVSAALAYGWQDITTNRTVTVAGSDLLRAEFNANAFSGRLEGGYRYVAPWVGGIGITPYAAAQFTTFDLPAYAEQAIAGSNAFALSYNAKDVTDTRTELGIRTDKSFAMTDGILILRGRLAWAHDFDPDRSIAATFQTLPGASFVVNGAAQAADSALVTASVEKKWLNGWSAAATFEGEFSDVTRSYAGKGVVRYQW
jgi:uncharacterized protein with beta-barrel porin domain